ncbi:N-acetylmuramoyl-L-alanine amidase [Streptomyces sp. NPDC051940]|uniref:peptidoglycan recognition protein family protein n=1 Tax=Streptomyces sp. NPDC051940 TaxID=3155675 RepID=UPI0034333113
MRVHLMRGRRWAVPLLTAALAATGLLAPSGAASAAATQRSDDFSLIGISWPASSGGLGGTAQVRTRDAASGDWSAWRALEVTPQQVEEGPRARERRTTEPLWAGPSDAAEARVVHADGSVSALPSKARMELVSPGEPAPSTASPYAEAGPQTLAAAPQPSVVSRAGWGADESLRADPPEYGESVKAVFVHHTVNANSYSCSEAPAIIRSIYRYHVLTNGWNDIGYNFLVDKCGKVYEGRYGGISKPVIGAHTLGFNTNTAGVAAIGDYSNYSVQSNVVASVSRVAGWKLGLTGVKANTKVSLVAGVDNGTYKKGETASVYRVSGHRNVYATACPGASLYAKLGTIRTYASDWTNPYFSKGVWYWARTGTVTSTSVPVQLYWTAADDTGVRATYATSPSAATFGPSSTSWNAGVKPGATTTWTMKTVDWVGHTTWDSTAHAASIVPETSAKRWLPWTTRYSSNHLGGKALAASTAGASLKFTFTGSSVAWIATKSYDSGQAYVYLDGVKKATIDLRSSSVQYRQAVWAAHWSGSGTHTLAVKVVGTSGRPKVVTDGITVVN